MLTDKRGVMTQPSDAQLPLSEFIQRHRQNIIDDWVKFARTMQPWAQDLTKKELEDHAAELLDAIIADMGSSQSSADQVEKSKGGDSSGALSGVGKKHALDRLESGLTLDQLVSEFRALRASVLRQWGETGADTQQEVTRFNEAIDEALTESTMWYSAKIAQTKDQFLDILGHDLRTPLSAIILGTAVLAKSETMDVNLLGIVTRIGNSAGRMNRMVSDLLDLTRTRLGGGLPITLNPMDLAGVCRDVIAEIRAIHPDCDLRFEPAGNLLGEWDSDRLTQLLSNLLANASRYGCADGPVTVVARGQAEEVVLSVHNDGPPIPEPIMSTIFEPMVRHPVADDQHPTGLGLGLYIVREIVTAHGGTMEVTSLESDGTTFTVRLPRRHAGKPR